MTEWAERAELIAIILNVAATMHHIFRCILNIRSIDESLEHELGTNSAANWRNIGFFAA